MSEPYLRTVRSFVKREGRITSGQLDALERLWSRYGLDVQPDSVFNFADIFANHAPVVLEIGFGNGASLAEMAAAAPTLNFVGIEVHRPGVGHLLHEIEQRELSNVRVIREDAVQVLKCCIPKQSLHRVQLYFPDPWPKKKHHKRRIVQPEFIAQVAALLQDDGLFHMATDWEHYAMHMAELMQASTDFSRTAEGDFVERPNYRPLTKFEQRGLKLGHGVWDLVYRLKQKGSEDAGQ